MPEQMYVILFVLSRFSNRMFGIAVILRRVDYDSLLVRLMKMVCAFNISDIDV